MTTEPKKQIWQSRTIVTAIILIIIGFLDYFGIPIPEALRELITGEETVDKITGANEVRGIINVLLGLAIAYFRIQAKKAVEGGVDAVTTPLIRAWEWVKGIFKGKE